MTRLVAISALLLASCATEPKPEPPEAPKAKAMSVCKPLVGPPVPPDTRIWWPGQRIPSEVIFLVHGASKQPEKVADLVVRP